MNQDNKIYGMNPSESNPNNSNSYSKKWRGKNSRLKISFLKSNRNSYLIRIALRKCSLSILIEASPLWINLKR